MAMKLLSTTAWFVAALGGGLPLAHASALDAVVQEAAAAALAVPEATVKILGTTARVPDGCKVASAQLDRPLTSSGSLNVKLHGSTRRRGACDGWARVVVSVTAPVLVTTRIVRTGEALDAATTVEWREIHPGMRPAPTVMGGIAARTLMAGQVIDVNGVRAERTNVGGSVRVSVRAGGLTVEQTGRLVSCGGGRSCAVLPSGKHVEGVMENDKLVVLAP